MFAKIVNNTIESYPYNPQVDYPLTSFPVGASYPDFNCYWVYPTSPNNPNPDLYDAIENTPIFNGEKWEQSWTYIEKPPIPPQPDWDAFNGAVFANERFNQVFTQAINIRPLLAVSLPTAMDQVTTKGLTLFASLYGAVCALGGATAEDKLEWGQLARNANLPPEFIDIVEN